jgi:hypothetical protein
MLRARTNPKPKPETKAAASAPVKNSASLIVPLLDTHDAQEADGLTQIDGELDLTAARGGTPLLI